MEVNFGCAFVSLKLQALEGDRFPQKLERFLKLSNASEPVSSFKNRFPWIFSKLHVVRL